MNKHFSPTFTGQEPVADRVYHRLCGKPYTVDGTTRWCNRLPWHAESHDGDMGPHVVSEETRDAFEFGEAVHQTRAACSCGWRSAYYTDKRYIEIPRRQHQEECAAYIEKASE